MHVLRITKKRFFVQIQQFDITFSIIYGTGDQYVISVKHIKDGGVQFTYYLNVIIKSPIITLSRSQVVNMLKC